MIAVKSTHLFEGTFGAAQFPTGDERNHGHRWECKGPPDTCDRKKRNILSQLIMITTTTVIFSGDPDILSS